MQITDYDKHGNVIAQAAGCGCPTKLRKEKIASAGARASAGADTVVTCPPQRFGAGMLLGMGVTFGALYLLGREMGK